MSIRVLVVDDQKLFREGLCSLLQSDPRLLVVGQAADGAQCLRVFASCEPDVVLMDLHMPGIGGVEATRNLKARRADVKIVVLTTFDEDQLVFDALREGATSFLLKDASVDEIVEALVEAVAGGSRLSSVVANKVVSEFARLSRQAQTSPGDDAGLSPREREVLRLLGGGATNREIAKSLRIAEGTVKNHLTNIFMKLDVTDRTRAALKARELGLV